MFGPSVATGDGPRRSPFPWLAEGLKITPTLNWNPFLTKGVPTQASSLVLELSGNAFVVGRPLNSASSNTTSFQPASNPFFATLCPIEEATPKSVPKFTFAAHQAHLIPPNQPTGAAPPNPLLSLNSHSPFSALPPDPGVPWPHTLRPAPSYRPREVEDSTSPLIKTQFQSITAMRAYEHMSFEELRLADYSIPEYQPPAPSDFKFRLSTDDIRQRTSGVDGTADVIVVRGVNPFLTKFKDFSLPHPFTIRAPVLVLLPSPPQTFTSFATESLTDPDPARSGTLFHSYMTPVEEDALKNLTAFHNIGAMKPYQGWSPEELRFRDYENAKERGKSLVDLAEILARLDI